jgi:polysaccharide biosynthesis/export protein
MKINLPLKNTHLILFIIIPIIYLSSCIPQKKIKLVQTKIKNDTINEFILKQRPKNTVQPFDNLFIKVISPDEVTSRMFNNESYGSAQQNINYNMISYTVNDSGYIDFPFVGLLQVKDLTILEAKVTIQEALSRYISNATVVVKFVGKSVTVIGEVNRQGKFDIFSDNVNIFTVLSMAQGLTDYGNRENVTIIREIDGVATYHFVDLSDRNILHSDFYYLKPEDIVIVQPLKQKSYGFSSFPYGLVLSGMTTIIALVTLFRTF